MLWEDVTFNRRLYLLSSSDITTLTSASYQPSLPMHAGQHLLSIQGTFLAAYSRFSSLSDIIIISQLILFYSRCLSLGSPVSHSRPGALLGERSKQLFPAAVIPVSEGVFHKSIF